MEYHDWVQPNLQRSYICFPFIITLYIFYYQVLLSQIIIFKRLNRTFLPCQNTKYWKMKILSRSVHIALHLNYWPWRTLSSALTLTWPTCQSALQCALPRGGPAPFTNPSPKEERSWPEQVQVILHKFTLPWSHFICSGAKQMGQKEARIVTFCSLHLEGNIRSRKETFAPNMYYSLSFPSD